MFKVVQFDEDFGCFTERTLFRSFNEQTCWDYVRSRMNVATASGNSHKRFYVQDAGGAFIDEPEDISALRRNVLVLA